MDGKADAVITKDEEFLNSNYNIVHEFSINWEKPKNAVIKKKKYEVKSQFYSLLQNFTIANEFQTGENQL